MIFYILVLLSALSISATAAYFSILGLATMFPGSALSVIIMGTVLEVGKIVAAVWLHSHWKEANKLIKWYLTIAVGVLMLVTSMGIFGFLSKAHIEHSYLTEREMAQVTQIDEKIAREKQFISRQDAYIKDEEKRLTSSKDINLVDIEREEKRISQLNEQLNRDISFEQSAIDKIVERRQELDAAVATLEASPGGLFSTKKDKLAKLTIAQAEERADIQTKIKSAEDRIQAHRQKADKEIKESRTKIASFQQDRGTGQGTSKNEIEKYNKQINEASDRINELQITKLGFDDKIRALEAEVGPIKYVAKLFQDLGASEIALDKAVRMVIVVLIFVFDPLAVLLVLAAAGGLHKYFKHKKIEKFHDKLEGLDVDVLFEKFTELDSKIEELQARKDFAPAKEVNELQSQVAELNQELDEIPNLPDREEIKGIIEFYEGNKKKINEHEHYNQNPKLNGILHRARVEFKKTKSLIKNNHRRILANTKMARQNKAAGASSFKKIVSSMKTKIEKF